MAISRDTKFSCEELDPRAATAEVTNPPTRSLSMLCSLAAELAAMQLLRHLLGLGGPVGDSILEYSGYRHNTVISPIKRNVHCPCEHRHYPSVATPRPILDCTLRELVQEANLGGVEDLGGVSFRVGTLLFRELGACWCKASRPLNRFYAPGEHIGRCSDCGSEIRSQPFFTHDPVPASLLASQLDRPLRDITTGPVGYVLVRGPEQGAFLVNRSEQEGTV